MGFRSGQLKRRMGHVLRELVAPCAVHDQRPHCTQPATLTVTRVPACHSQVGDFSPDMRPAPKRTLSALKLRKRSNAANPISVIARSRLQPRGAQRRGGTWQSSYSACPHTGSPRFARDDGEQTFQCALKRDGHHFRHCEEPPSAARSAAHHFRHCEEPPSAARSAATWRDAAIQLQRLLTHWIAALRSR